MESHGFIRKVQDQRSYPQVNVCYGAQHRGVWLVEKRKNPSVQSYNLDSSFPGCWDICGVCVHAKSLQSCLTLCSLLECSPPGSSFHGILHARILEWIAIPSSKGSSPPRDWTQVRKILWRRKWQPTPVLLPGKSHGQRSMVGSYSPWGHKESDMTERLHSLTQLLGCDCFLSQQYYPTSFVFILSTLKTYRDRK